LQNVTEELRTALADRYVIESELGEGGMATVYLAHDTKHNRKVALKVMKPELAAMIGAERFLKEIEVTANLQHPHILPLHDSGEAQGFLYYVMPFVEGETLRAKLDREKQFAIDDAVELARAICGALDYAHRQGVIHRDIKPENILLVEGQPQVADFGIALAVSQAGGTRLTETGLSIGTPQYMSPEQAMGDRELDARSDVYSVGAMLYEMLTGDPPYMGSTAQAIVAKVITEHAPPVTATRDTVPPNVASAVDKALAKLPADRFPSAAQFAEALGNPDFIVMTSAATAAAPVAQAGAGGRWKVAALALGVTTVVLAGLAARGWLQPDPVAPVIRSLTTFSEGQEMLDGVGVRLALSPDGQTVAYVGGSESGGQLLVRRRDQLEATPLQGTDGAANPFFSPDGRHLGYHINNLTALHTIPVAGGPPLALADSGVLGGYGSWSEDGWIYTDTNSGIGRIRAGGGPLELVVPLDTSIDETGHANPEPLPGGRGLLYRSRSGSAGPIGYVIMVLDFQSGERRHLMPGLQARYLPTGHLVVLRYDGVVAAVPFDLEDLALTGDPVSFFGGVRTRAFGAADLAFSLNGSVAYVPGGNVTAGNNGQPLWLERRDRSIEPVDTDWAITPAPLGGGGLAISPDGLFLAVGHTDVTTDLWVKRLPMGPLSRLTFEGEFNIRPVWAPGGRDLLYASNRNGRFALWQKRADGSGSAELLLEDELDIIEGLWSPDGTWLVYSTIELAEFDQDIYGIRPGVDSVPMPLVVTGFQESGPTISPDGHWLAYRSNESGRDEIYVRPFPNTDGGRWQVSKAGGTEPLWSHSGRELFYVDGTGSLVAVTVMADPSFSTGQETTLFDGSNPRWVDPSRRYYDVTSDDQRFVMVRTAGLAGGTSQSHVVIIDNWFEELREKMRTGG
jgi:tRNA A-37 threonylcarbamoyl transferase component Bud32